MRKSDAMIEKLARHLAMLEPDEDWPTNAELGGNLTGTRDDEYHEACREEAREIIELLIEEEKDGNS